MQNLVERALGRARQSGASYADARIVHRQSELIAVRNGRTGGLTSSDSMGIGVRSIADGAWGFAASSRLTPRDVESAAEQSVRTARSSARLRGAKVSMVPEEPHLDTWTTPYLIDPFSVPMGDKLNLLHEVDRLLRKDPRIVAAESFMIFRRERTWLGTSAGTFMDRTILESCAGFEATAAKAGDSQRRSYPSSHGGQAGTVGYELVLASRLLENAERIRDEAVSLLTAPICPSGKKDLILDGSQLALQIHESAGHPSELDRVLGMEANYAGTSFLTIDKLGKFCYGSPIVNIVADSTLPGGLATRGSDDEGVPGQRWHIVRDGVFVGYHTSREVASAAGENRSRGCCRADGWENMPIVRITNLSLMPGEWSLDDLIADTKDGILMATNKSWSIDQRRLNFQFGTEIAWEIKRGRMRRMLKNPSYQGITPEFWASCDAICHAGHWKPWGLTNCGKGQPLQIAAMSHGAAPARFRNVNVGVRPT